MADQEKLIYYAQQEPAPTLLVGSGKMRLGPDSRVGFSSSGSGNVRQMAVITNNDNGQSLQLFDSQGKRFGSVFPNTHYIIESGDNFIIGNSDALTSVEFSVCEYFLKFTSRPTPLLIRGTVEYP